ncbi:[Fe-Fe] hydrogenase large subunit C-terminal domain-containing protein [Orenia marismortui]|uniref:Iron only hydrogenase large subunit-like protein n=1 Tax=Orenia marismortui TaxID=46469 RepID=A0A4R8GY47_9FIRM|nr:[Fe-Fe] hydrogenase large subunit C-terminal domain-containing protein [Orenia marismortui]TDX51325.1 iron only hydrogenase large subunit-like protein [Orenia marismortui]
MSIITLSQSECKDCYRCVRDCSVKAIKINNGQAEVVKEKCINCGHCIKICPQNAKGINNHLEKLKKLLKKEKIVASIAPSFPAAFDFTAGKLIKGLKELGFVAVEETSVGAEIIARKYSQLLEERNETLISACCPSVVSLIEKHYPDLIPHLSPTISPMIAHAKMLKDKYKGSKVVFIGPCIAKISEIDWESSLGSVDLAITFDELDTLFKIEDIDCKSLVEEGFGNGHIEWSRAFPIQNGILKAADIKMGLNTEALSISGLDECITAFESLLKGEITPKFIEAMVCSGGCINGPGITSDQGINSRKESVIRYTQKGIKNEGLIEIDQMNIDTDRYYTNRKVKEVPPTESQIKLILSQIGKFTKDDELDCGGCGYDTCRQKAIAVYHGLAELKMCIPYMKGKMESLADIVVESSPNAIIVVDKDMKIQKFNPKADELFNRNNEITIGHKLYRYIDPKDFLDAWINKKAISKKRVEYQQYSLICEQSIFPLVDYELVIGIIADVTEQENHKEKIAKMKETTLDKASQVINKQMKVAQEIAGLLGESTAETKSILYEVRQLMQEEER